MCGRLQYDMTNAVFPDSRSQTDGAASKTLGSPALEGEPGTWFKVFLAAK
jgi:hypothetical protein